MRMIKCDRCGSINETGNKIIIYKNSTAHSDGVLDIDLCADCERRLWELLKPLDEVRK